MLGETDGDIRKSDMGIVIEYANRSGKPQWTTLAAPDFHYEIFGGSAPQDTVGVKWTRRSS